MRRAALLLLLALVPWTSVRGQEAEDVHGIIDRHNANLERWYAAGEIDSVASVFAEDAWQMPPNSPPLVGREAIRQFWSQAVQWGRWDFTLEAQDVAVSGPMAVERGSYDLGFTPGPDAPPGMPGFEDSGNYLVHWRLEEDGEWRIVADAPVSERPMPSPPAGSAEDESSM